jgi:hypothetical protein
VVIRRPATRRYTVKKACDNAAGIACLRITVRRVMDEEPEDRWMFFGTGKTWLAMIILLGVFAAAYLIFPGFRVVVDFALGQ